MSTGVEQTGIHYDKVADRCLRCGYDLRGTADDQPCSECGLLAERSRQKSDLLVDASPRWLRSIARGITWVLLAHVVAFAWPFVFAYGIDPNLVRTPVAVTTPIGIITTIQVKLFGVTVSPELIYMLGFYVAGALLFLGLLLLTRRQGVVRAGGSDFRRRLAIRLLAPVPLMLMAGMHYVNAQESRLTMDTEFWIWIIVIASCVFGAALSLLMFVHLRRMAQRVLNPHLAEHAIIVAVGYAAAILFIPIAAGVASLFDLGRSNVALFTLLIMGVAFLLFSLWSALNCLRFVLAFNKAYRGAQRLWTEADRSA